MTDQELIQALIDYAKQDDWPIVDSDVLQLAAARMAALSRVEAERDAAKRTLDGICSQIDNDCWLRKQFCENGDGDLEPCPCPSLREHSGYIDSDDCEGCKFFVNSWHGAQGEG